jgi:nucleotide-binding universal stress UspA family protein
VSTLTGAPVVVGVDGSAPSLTALRLATRLAVERDRPLRIVHAFVWPRLRVPLGPSPAGPPDGGLANEAERIVAGAAEQARALAPSLSVTGEVVTGAAAPVLLAEASQAAMLVLGDRGLGGFTGVLLGSVAVAVSAHATCPVVVARGDMDRPGPVVVGVDGSPQGARAIEFALAEADARGVGVTALHTYTFPAAGEAGDMLPLVYDEAQLRDEETAVLGEALAGWREKYPDVTVTPVVARDRAARALVGASRLASMVVVGSRGRGGFAGLLLGSVSQALLNHAACPVVVVR